MIVAGIAVLGGFGALARFLLDGAVSSQVGRAFPFGTLAVNLTGACAFGVLDGAAVGGNALRLSGIGFLGAYTTFSTWTLEAHRLGEDGRTRLGLANILVSLALGLGCAWLGRQLGIAL
jgi:fluoride exporter